MLTLEALQALDAIDRRGSFASAAESLHKVPSALSYTIRQLEDALGVELFDRSGQRARLTDTGRMVLVQGRELLAAAERLRSRARQSASGWEPRVRLAVEAVLPMAPLWPLVQAFEQAQPLVEVELREEVLNGSWEALQEQRVDLLIGVSRDAPAGLSLEFAPLGDLTFQLVCAAHHPLAGLAPDALDEGALRQYTQVVLRDSARQMQAQSVGLFDVQRKLLVNTYAAKATAIEQGVGFGHLAGARVRRALDEGKLVSLASVRAAYPVAIYLAWDKRRFGKGAQWWRDRLISEKVFEPSLT